MTWVNWLMAATTYLVVGWGIGEIIRVVRAHRRPRGTHVTIKEARP